MPEESHLPLSPDHARSSAGRLARKVAIITGAGTRSDTNDNFGSGRSAAILFAEAGASVLIVDLDQGNADRTLAAVQARGGKGVAFQADISKESDCKAMVTAALEHFGALHILFNNVGIGGSGMVTEVEEEAWQRVMDVNLKGMVLAAKYAVPAMQSAGGGSIINVSSIDGMRAGMTRNIPYSAAKGGVIAITRQMAVHHGRDNIRVNCLAPGHVHSNMVHRVSEEMRDLRRRAGPLGSEGSPWDIAWAALFLASDEARWISGVVLPIDAGLLAATPLAMLDELR
jgi:NAD(P)-dependent dehydrogenase (short-subunit alcohol dehydrogenase family)